MNGWNEVLRMGLPLALLVCAGAVAPEALAAERAVERGARFAVLHGQGEMLTAESLQAMGSYVGTRTDCGRRCTLTTKKLTYTPRGIFELALWAEVASEAEERRVGQLSLYHTVMNLTLEEFAAIFGGSAHVVTDLPVRDAMLNAYHVEARTEGGQRIVECRIIRIEDGARTEYGRLRMVLKDGVFVGARVTKQKKGLFGSKTVLQFTTSALTRTAEGLALDDDGPVGRIRDIERMRRAIADPTPKVFQELARETAR